MGITFLMPTNNPESFERYFAPSVGRLRDAQESITLSVIFQPPYTAKAAEERAEYLKAQGLKVIWQYKEYPPPQTFGAIPFNAMRNDCFSQCPHDELYALCDDDFEFLDGAAEMADEICAVMRAYPYIGVVQCLGLFTKSGASFGRKSGYRFVTKPDDYAYYTACGYFMRPLKSGKLFPDDALKLLGCGEEYVLGLERVREGFAVLERTNSRVYHHSGRVEHLWNRNEVVYADNGTKTYLAKKYGKIFREVLENGATDV